MTEPLTCDLCGSQSDIIEDSEELPAFAGSKMILLCTKCEDKYLPLILEDSQAFLRMLDKIN